MRKGVQLAAAALGVGAAGCGSVTAVTVDAQGTAVPSAVQLDCPDEYIAAGNPTHVLMKSTATPQQIADRLASAPIYDEVVVASVVAQSDTEAVAVLERQDGSVNTVLRLSHSDQYGWHLDSMTSCGHPSTGARKARSR